jgi:hypothetical protein
MIRYNATIKPVPWDVSPYGVKAEIAILHFVERGIRDIVVP